jgi:RHS repeat-associated protein
VPLLLKDGSSAYIYGPSGQPLEQVNALWLHHDQLGSTRLITDATGATQATYAYGAYGSVTASGPANTTLRFAGQYQDPESGLVYMRARYYDPTTAQFLTRDPMVAKTMSPYAYVAGNPLNVVDPSGLCGLWGDDICGWASTTYNVVATVVEAPVAVGQSVVLTTESVLSSVIYLPYAAAWEFNKNVAPHLPGPLQGPAKFVMSVIQRASLNADQGFDQVQQWSGYPGACQNDEGQRVNIRPSLIYPTFGNDGLWKWKQNKFSWGPLSPANGPKGVGSNGVPDYAD